MEGLIYLDHAAPSFPKPDAAHDAVREFSSTYGVNPSPTPYPVKRIGYARMRLPSPRSSWAKPSAAANGPPPGRMEFSGGCRYVGRATQCAVSL